MDRFRLNTATNLWLPEDSKNKLTKTVDANNLPTGWQFTDVTNDSTETYAVSGQLKSLQQRNGQTTTLQYDASQKLLSATNAFGRRLTFTHNPAGLVSAFTAPGGEVTRFDYDARNNLTQITWPDNNIKRFHYEDSRHPRALTGVTDELGVRIGTYAYDAQGRVVDTQKAGGADRVQLSYTTAPNGTPRTQVTDFSNGGATSRTYDFTNLGGILRPAAVSAPCPLCGSTAQATQYDAAGNKTREVAHDGTVNFYLYNAKGQETERATYGINYGTATTRPALSLATSVISTQWHATWNLPTQIAQAGQISSYSYNAKGMLTGQSTVATTDATGAAKFSAIKTGPVNATGYSYNASGLNSTIVQKLDAVETQRWTLAYNAGGDLVKVTDVTGAQNATLTNDANGRLTRLSASNGALATFGANSRGQMITANTPSGNVSYVYDARNLINEIRFGDGRWVRYSYNAAQKLIEIRDSSGLVEVIAAGEAEGLDPQRLALRVAQWLADRGDRVAQMLVPQAHAQTPVVAIPVGIASGMMKAAERQNSSSWMNLASLVLRPPTESAAQSAPEPSPEICVGSADDYSKRKSYCLAFCQFELNMPGRFDNFGPHRACMRRCMGAGGYTI